MFDFSKKLSSSVVLVFALWGLVSKTGALYCGDGIENSAGYVYRTKLCTESKPACFQSVKCPNFGNKVYEWDCIDRGLCSNATGKYIAHYNGVRGICCFTDTCNAYKGACTDLGLVLTAKWTLIVLTTAVSYAFVYW